MNIIFFLIFRVKLLNFLFQKTHIIYLCTLQYYTCIVSYFFKYLKIHSRKNGHQISKARGENKSDQNNYFDTQADKGSPFLC